MDSDITAIDVVARSILHAFEHCLLDILQVLVVVLIFWDESESKMMLKVEQVDKQKSLRIENAETFEQCLAGFQVLRTVFWSHANRSV